MKKIFLFYAFLMLTHSGFAESSRMQLLIGHNYFTDINQCNHALTPSDKNIIIRENDIVEWNPKTGYWTLDSMKFSRNDILKQLQDHCFNLIIDNQLVTKGAIVSSYSARLIRLPTIILKTTQSRIDLQLNSGHGNNEKLIFIDKLNEVLP